MFHLKKQFAFPFFLFLFHSALFAQVGIGTSNPKAAMDVASTNQGFLMPRIALSATNVPTLVNPNGGSLEVGTMVFNTANTAGTYGVTVTDQVGCQISTSITLTQPAALALKPYKSVP